MAKTHHDVLVGMMGLNGIPAMGSTGATFDSLKTQLRRAYEGDPISPYQACNAIHTYLDQRGWTRNAPDPGETTDPPYQSGPDHPDEDEREYRIEHNADAQATFIRAIAEVNAEVGGGNLIGVISRNLAALVKGKDGERWAWDPDDLADYAGRVCQKIKDDGNEDLVAGWYLSDEGWFGKDVEKEHFRTAAVAVHQAQKCKGVNWPFLWAEPGNASWTAQKPDRYFWKKDATTGKQRYAVWPDTEFDTWLRYFFPDTYPPPPAPPDPNQELALGDATLVFMPFDYPWASPLNRLRYRRHQWFDNVVSDKLAENPPMMGWDTWLDVFRTTYPTTDAGYASRLKFNPVIAASMQESDTLWPRHVDMHRTIRGLLDLRQKWIDDYADHRLSGFWMISWNQGLSAGRYASDNWEQTGTTKYRYAEAVQNEVTAGTEAVPGISGASDSKILDVELEADKFRVEYQVAPTAVMGSVDMGDGTTMGERPQWHIDIRMTSSPTGALVRRITEHEDDDNAPTIPHGIYNARADAQGADELVGTSAYWDRLYDRGGNDGKDAPGENQQYGAWLVLNGDTVTQTDGLNLFTNP